MFNALILFPLNDIRRQHVYTGGNYCEKLKAVRVWPLPGSSGG